MAHGRDIGLRDLGLFRDVGFIRFPKTRGSVSGVPIRRTIAFWGRCWGSPFLEGTQLPDVFSLGLCF